MRPQSSPVVASFFAKYQTFQYNAGGGGILRLHQRRRVVVAVTLASSESVKTRSRNPHTAPGRFLLIAQSKNDLAAAFLNRKRARDFSGEKNRRRSFFCLLFLLYDSAPFFFVLRGRLRNAGAFGLPLEFIRFEKIPGGRGVLFFFSAQTRTISFQPLSRRFVFERNELSIGEGA